MRLVLVPGCVCVCSKPVKKSRPSHHPAHQRLRRCLDIKEVRGYVYSTNVQSGSYRPPGRTNQFTSLVSAQSFIQSVDRLSIGLLSPRLSQEPVALFRHLLPRQNLHVSAQQTAQLRCDDLLGFPTGALMWLLFCLFAFLPLLLLLLLLLLLRWLRLLPAGGRGLCRGCSGISCCVD